MAAVQIFKSSRLFPATKPNPLLCLPHFSSAPSDQTPPEPNPLIPSVVSILTNLRSKSRWGYLRSLYPSGFTPTDFSQIALQIKNNPHLVLRFFQWTQNHNNPLCSHNLLSFSTTIHILARSRLKSQAYSLIRDAIRVSEPLQVFEALVKTYRQCGSAPFVFDYLIRACLESKKIDPALQIVRMLLSRGINPGLNTCNSLIRCVMQARGAWAGYEIYREVFGLDGGVRVARARPNVQTFNELMLGFYQDGAVEMVEEIWDQMPEFGCCADVYSYSILMETYCEDEKMSNAEELWEEMRGKGVEPDAVAYNTMIGGFCRVGEIEMAEEFFKQMGLSGIESSGAACEHLVRGYCKIGKIDEAMLVYKDMLRKDFRAESLTVDELIRGLCGESRVLEALEVMRAAMIDYGFCPREKSYEFLIGGLCEQGKLEEALKLQAQMVGKGFKPNSEIYSAFISGYMKEGNKEVAELLRNEMLDTQVCGIAD
ncbi:putative pentatricopeptide [Rosa chinensis]|uniref:Putative pentatricopeptide n=1 Tax=Rosa chinensis TaxID=74649 RepID=A0A2P6PJ69_ROSCH|nr:pentatricopeptide repeat-containing protein At2g15980 [Rosa chinensis]PRQ21975.1 putative pentatricopeptide [Rosa chinensis]